MQCAVTTAILHCAYAAFIACKIYTMTPDLNFKKMIANWRIATVGRQNNMTFSHGTRNENFLFSIKYPK